MKHFISVLALVLLVFYSSYGQDATVSAIKATFDQYRTAFIDGKAEKAVKFVDKKTLKYYQDILDHVIKSDSLTVDGLGLLEKIMIFSIREKTSKKEILSFDGKKLLIYAIENNFIGKNSIDNLNIGDVTVNGATAKGKITQQGYETPYAFDFYKENKKWKIDVTSILPDTQKPMEMMLEQEGLSANEYVFILLEMVNGEVPSQAVWTPIKP